MIKRKTYRTVALLFIVATIVLSLTTPIIMSESTTQQTKLTLQVYPDASVRWVGEYYNTTNVSSMGNTTVMFLANLTQLKKGLELLIKANAENFSSVSKTGTKVEFTLNVNGEVRATNETMESHINFNLYMYSEKDEIKIKAWSNKPIETVFNRTNLYAEISGNVSVAASGNNAIGIIFTLSLLNKGYIESQLAKSNITYIDVKKLKTTTSPSGATIVFDIGINYTKMMEELSSKANTTNKPSINPEKLKELLETYFIPYNATYRVTVFFNNNRLQTVINVNSTLSVMEAANMVLKILGKYAEVYANTTVAPGSTVPIHTNITKGIEDAKKILSYLGKLINRFEILPSSAYISLNVTKNYVHVKFETFKIRAKGAKTPEDTLKTIAEVLQELKTKISNTTLESSEGKEVKSAINNILGSEAVIEGVGGVKVNQTKVPLSELDKVKVVVTQATTTSTTTKTTTTTPPTSTTTITTSITQTSTTTSTTTTSTTTSITSVSTSSKTTTTSSTSVPVSTTVISSATVVRVAGASTTMITMIIVGVIAAAVVIGAVIAIVRR